MIGGAHTKVDGSRRGVPFLSIGLLSVTVATVHRSKAESSLSVVQDYHAVNATIEEANVPMLGMDALARFFAAARVFCTLDLIQG